MSGVANSGVGNFDRISDAEEAVFGELMLVVDSDGALLSD